MKNKVILPAMLAGVLVLAAFTWPEMRSSAPMEGEFVIPENINAIQ